jgi:translation elongation factor EF-4
VELALSNTLISPGDKIVSCHTRKRYEVVDLGIMHPEEVPTQSLRPGQVGYVACNMKESSEGKYYGVLCGSILLKLCRNQRTLVTHYIAMGPP